MRALLHVRDDVGSNAEHPTLCGRCVSNSTAKVRQGHFASGEQEKPARIQEIAMQALRKIIDVTGSSAVELPPEWQLQRPRSSFCRLATSSRLSHPPRPWEAFVEAHDGLHPGLSVSFSLRASTKSCKASTTDVSALTPMPGIYLDAAEIPGSKLAPSPPTNTRVAQYCVPLCALSHCSVPIAVSA